MRHNRSGSTTFWEAVKLSWAIKVRLWAKLVRKKFTGLEPGPCRQDVQLTALKNTLYIAISIHVAIPLKTSTLVNFEVAQHVLGSLSTIWESLTLSWAKKLEKKNSLAGTQTGYSPGFDPLIKRLKHTYFTNELH